MDQLDSWKEIAAHLGRTVRTVQRWETTCGLPVHRHGHAKSSSVYAFLSEVDRWWTSQQQPLKDGQTPIELSARQLQVMSRYYWNTRTVEGLQRSIALALRAVERDPRDGAAHAALAIAYATLGSYTSEPPSGPMERARQSALHALELDETLADAHLTLGFVSLCYDWDFDQARSLLGRALARNPQNASAWQWHSLVHVAAGDVSRGIEFARRAVELDTSSPILKAHLSWMLYFARRYEDALEQTGRALSRDSRFWRAYFNAGWCAIQLGDYDRAVNAMETMVALNDYPTARAALVVAYGRAGREQKARETLATVLSSTSYVSQYWLAIAQLALADAHAASAALQRACENREWYLILLDCEPLFDSIRSDRTFLEVKHRVGV